MLRIKNFFAAIIFSLILIASSAVSAADTPPTISADSAILIEAGTGRVIYEKNADVERPPASMTKMMTCILGLEYLSPSQEIKISSVAAGTEYSDLGLAASDIITARELLMGMMLVSDNGGAVAVAEAVGGTIPLFADMMTQKAREIGCTDTNFANPNGLTNPNHYSTARDMAKIAAYCMKNREFRHIVSSRREDIRQVRPADRIVEAVNTNDLLGVYDGMNGIKTGYTAAAGGCFAASAKRGDVELIAIIMHSADKEMRFDDAAKLLDYGFENVQIVHGMNKDRVEKVVFVRGGKQGAVHIGPEEDLIFPILKGEDRNKLTVSYKMPKVIDAGIERGDIIGEVVLKYDGKPVANVPLVARENVAKGFSLGSAVVGLTEPIMSVAQNVLMVFLA